MFCSVSGWWHAPVRPQCTTAWLGWASYWKVREPKVMFTTRWMNVSEPKKKRQPGQELLSQGFFIHIKKNKKKEWITWKFHTNRQFPPSKKKMIFCGKSPMQPSSFFWGGVQKGLRLRAMCELKRVKTLSRMIHISSNHIKWLSKPTNKTLWKPSCPVHLISWFPCVQHSRSHGFFCWTSCSRNAKLKTHSRIYNRDGFRFLGRETAWIL